MAKISKRKLKLKELRKEFKLLTRNFENNENSPLPLPPSPLHTITDLKINVDYIGQTILVRVCAYSNLNVFRKIFKFNLNDDIYTKIFNLISSVEFYSKKYNKKYLEV